MKTNLPAFLRWTISLSAKFWRVVPRQTSAIVLLTVVSQLGTLLGSFLPLKVVILLGSAGIPSYVPDWLAILGREALIVGFSVGALVLFGVHLLADRLISSVTGEAGGRLLEKSQKITLFDNQQDLAASAYERFSRTLAGGVFFLLALLGLALLYPGMSVIVVAYVVAATGLLWAGESLGGPLRERLEERFSTTVNLAAGLGFFAAFAYLVTDFILLSPPGVSAAIISLLLSRQAFTRVAAIAQDLKALHSQRARYDALFFHSKVLVAAEPRQGGTIWPLLERGVRERWVADVLTGLLGELRGVPTTTWLSSGVANTAVLRVPDPTGQRELLVKLYESNRESLARHEAMLLSAPPPGLPAPTLLGSTEVDRFPCLVYSIPPGGSFGNRGGLPVVARTFRANLLQVDPPQALVRRYERSRPLLWQRLSNGMLMRLRVAADNDEQDARIMELIRCLWVLQGYLAETPLCIVNPDVSPAGVWVRADEGAPLLLNWGRWSLDPIGAGWGDQDESLRQLGTALEQARDERPSLSKVTQGIAKAAALAHTLESRCSQQDFLGALGLVDRIVEELTALERGQIDSRHAYSRTRSGNASFFPST